MNNKGVSAVIGVILMIAITVAIAGTVYVYISSMLDFDNETDNITGIITDKFIVGSHIPYYYFVIDYIIELEVNLTTYYSYDIGDFYNGL